MQYLLCLLIQRPYRMTSTIRLSRWKRTLLKLTFLVSLIIFLQRSLPFSTIKSGVQENPYTYIHKINTKLNFAMNQIDTNLKFVKNYGPINSSGRSSEDDAYSHRGRFICPIFRQRLGNQMFQYASSYGAAIVNNMSVIVGADEEVARFFKLDADTRDDKKICMTTKILRERWACAFDEKLLHLNKTENYTLGRWLQSWRYFIHVEDKLRKQFVFKDHIQDRAAQIIYTTLNKRSLNRANVTLVGIHVRRSDKVNTNRGDQVASKGYIKKAIKYYQSIFSNTFFLVCSDGMEWCIKNIQRQNNIEFIENNTKEVDLSILASCDHVIQTVGSFSWWAAWLAGGTSIYFKWPAREGSHIRKSFSKDFSDFFYPGWIGMA